MLADNGLGACGTHVLLDAFRGDELKKSCEFCLGYGNNLLVCPENGIPEDWDKPADDWWKHLAEFSVVIEEKDIPYAKKLAGRDWGTYVDDPKVE